MSLFTLRPATTADADAIALTHRDSILTLGATAYDPEVVADWGAPRSRERYREAMARGTRFFIAVPSHSPQSDDIVLGFSSYAQEGEMHRTAVYVRGAAARQGIGRGLFALAEAAARDAGAPAITIEAALGAIPFWTALGFDSLGMRDHLLRSGRIMPCLLMRKPLA